MIVEGSLTLESEGVTISLRGDAAGFVVEVESAGRGVRGLVAMRRALPLVRLVARELHRRALTLRVVRNGQTIAVVGGGEQSGLVGRILGIDHVRLTRGRP